MQNLLEMLLQNNPQAANNIGAMLNTAGLADIALQGYQAWQSGQIGEFAQQMYDTNIKFRIFYDRNKDKSLSEILSSMGVNLK